MQKKVRLIVTAILVILMSIAITNSKAEAATVTVSPSKTSYTINGNKYMYKYVESSGTHKNIYCLNYAGVLNDGSVYTVSEDIYNLSADKVKNIFGTTENYNKSMWLMDNMMISQGQSKDEMNVMVNQLKEILHSDIAKKAIIDKYNVPNLTNGDIDNIINHVYSNGWYDVFFTVQQSVMWNYTVNTKPFPGLTSLSSGYDIQGKYYMWMYTGLKAVADTKGSYNSPNKNGTVETKINSITMDSKSATIDVQNKKVGPFIINGYSDDIITKKDYSVKVNGSELKSSDYTVSFDGKNLYITIQNTEIDLSAAKVDVAMNIVGVKTSGTYLYKQYSQDIVSLKKDTVPKKIVGSTEDTEFDLRLIKNIAGVWNTNETSATLKYDLNSDILKTRNIQRVSSLKNGDTTEIWNINKYPIAVSTGDIVKYQITIANEGNLDGFATKITDYIADGLELVSKDELVKLGIINENDEYYGWSKEQSENGFTAISTTYLSDKTIKAYDKTSDTVDTKVVYIYCKVTSNQAGVLLKDIAEITADKTVNMSGKDVDDRDSTPGSIKMSKLSANWKGNNGNKNTQSTNINKQYSYPGKEDDDDFDAVKVQNFDLALTKQITSVTYADGTKIDLSRLIDINKEALNNGELNKTTASYNMNKKVVNVTKDSIVTYKITVYNEGDINGYAKEITDYLPNGLEFYSGTVNGIDYKWNKSFTDYGTTKITTDYLSNRCLYAYSNNNLSSAEVEIQCKVVSDTVDTVLMNVAEITNYGYYIGDNYIEAENDYKGKQVDRDSMENNVKQKASESNVSKMIKAYKEKVLGLSNLEYIDKTQTNYEDDDDFECVKIINKELDLALRKSISAINGNSVVNGYNLSKNRLPRITETSASTALSTGNAEYYHNKEAINVNVNDEITYTIRVYNEGNTNDYCGYAKEITDYLPDGLTFVKLDESSKNVWSTEAKEGDSTVVLKYNGNKTIYNNSLSKIAKLNQTSSENTENLYQTVSIICKVNNVSGYLTNRAEITSEVATDENGTIVEGIKDRDSTPGSVTRENSKLDTYYKDYNRKYGIDDTYIGYYPGEENGKKEDDTDFETIYVEKQEIPETIDITGTKTWDDEGNKDGVRPEKITIYLLANGKQVDSKEITEKDGWKYSFTGLAKYDENKKEIVYTVDESEVEKYTKKIEGYNITNTHKPETPTPTPETVDVEGTKTWDDEGNKDGVRPEKITIYLLANGKQVDSKEITEKDGWKYSFTGLEKYDENKKEIVYTVDESEVEKYTKKIEGYNITNTHKPETPTPTPETVDIEGTKTWNDDNDKNGKRPKNIIVNVLANGTKVTSKIVIADENGMWNYKFTGLQKLDENGKEIVYSVDEEPVDYYDKKIEGYNIINTYHEETPPETVEITGTKTWNDSNDKDKIRPKALRVYLLANGEKQTSIIVTEKENWKYTFTNLPKYDEEGKEIVYSVDEEQVAGYSKKIDGYNITNTHTPKVELDFSLRKFITEINGVNVTPSREPVVDTTKLANGTSTTATYTHPKDAKLVNTGDVVTYTLRIYNEGQVDGYASLIKDEIPEGLQFIVNDSTNTTYGWKMLNSEGKETTDVSKAKYVVTDYLSKAKNEQNLIGKFNTETKQLNYKDVKVSFKVISEDTTGKEIVNHAQISEETDSTGKKATDRDSTPNKWIDGEDDQDIEKIKLTYLDLSLRKFITKVNESEITPNRAPVVDITKLKDGTSTTATYNHPKDTVNVSKDDIVTYTLRIYNEGSKDGMASLVKDSIPEGLQFIPSNDTNKKYNWKMLDENGNETSNVTDAKYVVTDYLAKTVIKAYNSEEMETLDYKDVEVSFKVIAPETTKNEIINYAQISKETDSNGNVSKDRDSTPDKWIDGEDDQDIEKIKLTYADLALRKFITELNDAEVSPSRAPQVDVTDLVNETSTTAKYNHTKTPIEVQENDVVTYTLRIYNEGTKNVYASLVKDDIPEGLEFITDNELNKKYNWKMLDENNNETTDTSKAKYIVTDYLATDLIKAFNPKTMTTLDYKDVKVSFKVNAPKTKDQEITNYAQISKETDENGKDVKDRDSTPNKWIDGEDDQDTEKIKLKYFDLALQKWVSKAIVIEDGKEKVTKTGHTGDQRPEPIVKVDLKKSKISNVVVKFEYQIKVINEGQIAGYAKEVSDYIPDGLKFIQNDNINWREEDGKIVTNELENTLLQPGESATVSVILTWINNENNLGLKTNIAEISKDADSKGNKITDIDSTPNNKVDGEDDQDTAPIILTIKTGATTIYTSLIVAVIAILGIGVYGIKKYVL